MKFKMTAARGRFLHVTLLYIKKQEQICLCTKFYESGDTSFVKIGIKVYGVPAVVAILKSNMAAM